MSTLSESPNDNTGKCIIHAKITKYMNMYVEYVCL